MIEAYWLDMTLAYILDHAVCCVSATSPGRSLRLSHYKPVRKRSLVHQTVQTMFRELKVRLSSIKQWSIVCQTVQSMFGELFIDQIKNRLNERESSNRSGLKWTGYIVHAAGLCSLREINIVFGTQHHEKDSWHTTKKVTEVNNSLLVWYPTWERAALVGFVGV